MKAVKFLPVIGIIIFILIYMNSDIGKIFSTLSGANPLYLILAIAMLIPINGLKAVKWKILLNSYGVKMSVIEAFKYWYIGFSIGMLTPGRLGDMSRAYYTKGKGSIGKTTASVVIDRFLDVFILFILSISSFVFFVFGLSRTNMVFIYVSGIFALFMVLAYAASKKSVMEKIINFFLRFVPKKHQSKMEGFFEDFYEGIEKTKRDRKPFYKAFGLGLLSWVILVIQYQVIILSLSHSVPLELLFLTVPVLILIETLPISFIGIGSRELLLLFFLSPIGLTAEFILSLSLLIFFVDYIISGLIGFSLWIAKAD